MKFRGKQVLAVSASVAAVALAVTALRKSVNRDMPLGPSVAADLRFFESRLGLRAAYYADESAKGIPLILVHSINAAASSMEMAPLFDAFRQERPVFLLDLPGFGHSDRPDRDYTPEFYVEFLGEFLDQIASVHGATDVVALSLSCEFAAKAALLRSGSVRSLAFLSPTGFASKTQRNATERARSKNQQDSIHRVVSAGLVGQPLFDAISSKASIRFFLGRAFHGPVPETLEHYSYASAHRPGAKHAPLAFISGKLFDPTIRTETYEALPMPVAVVYDKDPNVAFDELEGTLRRCSPWEGYRVGPSLGLPQWERPRETVAALHDFFDKVGAGSLGAKRMPAATVTH